MAHEILPCCIPFWFFFLVRHGNLQLRRVAARAVHRDAHILIGSRSGPGRLARLGVVVERPPGGRVHLRLPGRVGPPGDLREAPEAGGAVHGRSFGWFATAGWARCDRAALSWEVESSTFPGAAF